MAAHVYRHALTVIQRRLRWQPSCNAKVLLLSETDETSLIRSARHCDGRVSPANTPRHTARSQHRYCEHVSRRRQLLNSASSLKLDDPPDSARASPEIFVLASGHDEANHVHDTGSEGGLYRLPFTLTTLAAHIRGDKAAQLAGAQQLLPAFSRTNLQLGGQSTPSPACASAGLPSEFAVCAAQSKDCFIAELSTLTPPRLADAMTVAVHQLRRSGSFLVFAPHQFRVPRQALDYLKWQFAAHYLGQLADGSTFLFCSCLTGSDEAPRLRQSDFPGLLPKGCRRKRHWDRYGRNRNLYVANITPDYGGALFSKDTLGADLKRKQEEAAAFDERDGEFFSVSHDMVEKNRYAARPED